MKTIWGKPVYETVPELVAAERTALVLVDLQNDFCSPDGYYGREGRRLTEIAAAIPRVDALVAAARRADVLVIWVLQTLLAEAGSDSSSWLRRRTKGVVPPEWTIDGTWGQQVVAPLVPRPDEPVVKKHRSSSFVSTPLDLVLRSNGIEALVIAGTVTQGCVESTVRDATFFDYYVTLATDCVATIDPALHEASLLCQSTRCDFATSEQIIDAWQAAAGARRGEGASAV